MKADQTWSFSCQASRVDIPRILREGGVRDGNVVRFTVDGRTYTAWADRFYGPAPFELEQCHIPGRSVVEGDHAGCLLGRVAVDVEVFEP